jgi:chorismate mutase
MTESAPGKGLDELAILRAQVDAIDTGLFRLADERTRLTLLIGAKKEQLGIPVMVDDRHREVIEHYRELVSPEGPITDEGAVTLAATIMMLSRRSQEAGRIDSPAPHSNQSNRNPLQTP